jgi:hypothetical protein
MNPEITSYVPHPTIVLMGCQAWPPASVPGRPCPVCDRGVRPTEHTTYCAVCDSLSPRNEARVRAQLLSVRGRSDDEAAGRAARTELQKHSRGGLTESERRRLWNGYKGGLKTENPEPTNRAKVARDFLTERGMAPDWSLVLDRHGNVTGRYAEEVA